MELRCAEAELLSEESLAELALLHEKQLKLYEFIDAHSHQMNSVMESLHYDLTLCTEKLQQSQVHHCRIVEEVESVRQRFDMAHRDAEESGCCFNQVVVLRALAESVVHSQDVVEQLQRAAHDEQIMTGKLQHLQEAFDESLKQHQQLKAVMDDKVRALEAELQESAKQLSEGKDAMKLRLDQVQSSMDKSREEHNIEVEKLSNDKHLMEVKVVELEQNIDSLQAQRQTLVEESENAKKDLCELKELLDAKQQEVDHLNESVKQIENELMESREEFVKQSNCEREQNSQVVLDLQAELEKARQSLLSLERSSQEADLALQENQELIASLKNDICSLETSVAELNAGIRARDEELAETSARVSRESESVREEMSSMKNELKSITDAKIDAEQRFESCTVELEHRSQELQESEMHLSSVKHELEIACAARVDVEEKLKKQIEASEMALTQTKQTLESLEGRVQQLVDSNREESQKCSELQKQVDLKQKDLEEARYQLQQGMAKGGDGGEDKTLRDEVTQLQLKLNDMVTKARKTSMSLRVLESKNRMLEKKLANKTKV